jgi:LysM repeat protein
MMTRDAKIGLLVGLAFILIVGILLSEHITSATAPQQASLAQAGDRVRRAVSAPMAQSPAVEPVTVDPNPLPKAAVITRDVIDSPQLPPTARIELGPARGGEIKVIRVDAPHDPIASATQVQPMTADGRTQSAIPAGTPMLAATSETERTVTSAHPLQDAARAGGMELVEIKTISAGGEPKRQELPPIANGSKVKEYVAQPGDSLGRIASRQLGANTPANRGTIIALNPSLQKDNNRILVGAKYLLPADAWAAALGIDTGNVELASVRKPAIAAASGSGIYVVQSGDSLSKIAERELGSVSNLGQLKSLNADVLGGGDVVKIGMKLKLPARN